MIPQWTAFIKKDIWRLRAGQLKGPKGFLIRAPRILILSFREFSTDQCALRASALTFYSLLSIVPVFAMAFGIAKGFGLDKVLREKIMENLQGQEEVLSRVVEFSENLLQNTKGGIIAGIGLALLFWTVIQVLTNIEMSFNHIWGIKTPRTLARKFADYLAFMLIAPVSFIIASSATVFLASQIQLITGKTAFLGAFTPLILTGLKILPFAVFAVLLTYLYVFLPNGKIQFKSAFLGGLIAGVLYQIVQWVYIHFQIGASNAGAVYGTFAALPLFLTWLQTSWLIVLYGAELAFAHQNEDKFEFENESLSASYEFKKLLALRITQLCVARFSAGCRPLSDEKIADQLEMPIRLTRELLSRLTEAGVLSEVSGQTERERFYQPARDIGEMTIRFVIEKIEKAGTQDIPVIQTSELEKLRESLTAFDRALESLPGNLLLKDLHPTTAGTVKNGVITC